MLLSGSLVMLAFGFFGVFVVVFVVCFFGLLVCLFVGGFDKKYRVLKRGKSRQKRGKVRYDGYA